MATRRRKPDPPMGVTPEPEPIDGSDALWREGVWVGPRSSQVFVRQNRFFVGFWAFVLTCFALGYLGSQAPEGWYLILGRVFTFYYFAFFLVVMPVLGRIEKLRALPDSIADSMSRGKKRTAKPAKQLEAV